MKKKTILIVGIFLILILFLVFKSSLNKRNDNIIKYSKLNTQKTIGKGEWISNLDSLAGISVRGNKIAFFKNMKFTSEDVYEYVIIDSIYKNINGESKVGEFLMMKDFSDTIYYPILKKNATNITLKINGNKTETFNLKK